MGISVSGSNVEMKQPSKPCVQANLPPKIKPRPNRAATATKIRLTMLASFAIVVEAGP
jgi:hypothetical protein